ncbi:MAG: PQQ-dependent sugar dehydrogenase [Armatimonadetes bacterium]|nr:PQQ-dependent sugar dehydrogenase [Armatimonadota bacterium]
MSVFTFFPEFACTPAVRRLALASVWLTLLSAVLVGADCITAPVPGTPSVFGASTNSLKVAASASDLDDVYIAFLVTDGAYTQRYVQANGALGASPVWKLRTDWKAVTVTGLSSATSYIFQSIAARDTGGACASEPGSPAEGTTLMMSGAFAVPPGFSASLWMSPGSGINGGDGVTFAPYTGPGGGTRMFITNAYWGSGKVFSVKINGDGSAGVTQDFASGFEDQIVSATYNPANGYWYAGAGTKVYWMKDKNGDGDALDPGEKGVLLSNLVSAGSKHAVDKVQFNPQNPRELFFGVGSHSDHGESADPAYQAIIRRAMLSPTNPEQVTAESINDPSYYIYASGLRNSSGEVFLTDGRLVATEHAPDCDVSEELNVITQGACYGFPAWYADGTEPTGGAVSCFPQGTCNFTCPCPNDFTKPVALFPPHSAPIGIVQYTLTQFPLKYRGRLFVAEFGNLVNMQDTSSGRRLSMFQPDSDDGTGHWQRADFFSEPNTNVNTRQLSWLADVQQGPDGALYAVEFSNQGFGGNSGSIFRLSFSDPTPPTAISVQDEGSVTGSTSTLNVTWTPSFDPQSGIRQYWYSVGTAPGLADVRGWTGAGNVLKASIQGLSLQNGQTYYVNVRAENGNLGTSFQGVFSPVASTDGITVSVLPPVSLQIEAPSVTATARGPATFPVTYLNASSVSLSPSDVTLIATGSASGTISVVGSGLSQRDVVVSDITGDGTLAISIAAGTASNLSSSAPAAGPSAAVVVDTTAPIVSQASLEPDCVHSGGPLTVRATVQDSGTGVSASGALLLGSNIALNADFEDGTLTGWANGSNPVYTVDNAYPSPGTARSGLHWAGASCAYSSGVKTPELRQTVSVTPGVRYYLSAWVNTQDSPNSCSAYLQFKDGAPPSQDGECQTVPGPLSSLTANSTGWQRLSGVVQPSTNQLTICLKLSWACDGAGGGGNWDAVEIRSGASASELSNDIATWNAVANADGYLLVAVDTVGNSSSALSVPAPSIDDEAPVTTASAPATATGVVKVDWTASDTGCSGQIATGSVRLFARKSTGVWADSGLSGQSGNSGSFLYIPSEGSGDYYFAVVASDTAGNSLAAPSSGSGAGQTACTVTQGTLVQRIGQLWSMPDGVAIALADKIVSASLAQGFVVQESDRSAGVRVSSSQGSSAGQTVAIGGVLGTQGLERYVAADTVYLLNSASAPQPLYLRHRDLGGTTGLAPTPGVSGAISLFNVGLLVKVSGIVTYAEAGSFYLDDGSGLLDGSGHRGVRAYSSKQVLTGDFVTVTGICGLEAAPAGARAVVRARSDSDVTVLN